MMWRKRKFIIMLLGAVLIIAASIGGVAMAQDSEENSQSDSLLGRVAAILGIDQQRVEDAFEQAQVEMREQALDKYLQNLVDEGIGNDPRMIRMFARLGEMVSEDQLAGTPRGLTMTPDEAQSEIDAVNAQYPKHPYFDKKHPEHAAAVEKMTSLFQMANPGQKEEI